MQGVQVPNDPVLEYKQAHKHKNNLNYFRVNKLTSARPKS